MQTFKKLLSVTAAMKLASGSVVAKSESFEVWVTRARVGQPGRRGYVACFRAVRVLTEEVPRKTEEVELPAHVRSSLPKILDFLKER